MNWKIQISPKDKLKRLRKGYGVILPIRILITSVFLSIANSLKGAFLAFCISISITYTFFIFMKWLYTRRSTDVYSYELNSLGVKCDHNRSEQTFLWNEIDSFYVEGDINLLLVEPVNRWQPRYKLVYKLLIL